MLSFIMTLLLISPSAQAQSKKKVNTNIFESDSGEKSESFSAKVKVVREDEEGVEVFFQSEKQKGAYLLPRSAQHYGTMLKDLEASKKPQGGPVSVTVDSDKRIKSVEKGKANDGGFKIPDDPNQKWDFGKIPD